MPHYNQNHWIERNDNEPGFIYLILAEGYHGWIPGCVLKRVKIGLSRDPQARLETFHSNQPPCNLRIIRTIYVQDMGEVEYHLHQVFKNSNVKLKKSREFFDLLPWQMVQVHWLMTQYETKIWTYADIPKRALIGGLIALLGVGVMIGHVVRPDTPQIDPATATEKIK